MFYPGKQRESGMSLIEIITILVVAAIILPALIIPFTEGVRDLDIPVTMSILALLAQEELEKRVVCFSYQSVSSWTDDVFPVPFDNYTSTCVIDDTAAFGPVNTGVKEITVTVTHADGLSLDVVTVLTDWQ